MMFTEDDFTGGVGGVRTILEEFSIFQWLLSQLQHQAFRCDSFGLARDPVRMSSKFLLMMVSVYGETMPMAL